MNKFKLLVCAVLLSGCSCTGVSTTPDNHPLTTSVEVEVAGSGGASGVGGSAGASGVGGAGGVSVN